MGEEELLLSCRDMMIQVFQENAEPRNPPGRVTVCVYSTSDQAVRSVTLKCIDGETNFLKQYWGGGCPVLRTLAEWRGRLISVLADADGAVLPYI